MRVFVWKALQILLCDILSSYFYEGGRGGWRRKEKEKIIATCNIDNWLVINRSINATALSIFAVIYSIEIDDETKKSQVNNSSLCQNRKEIRAVVSTKTRQDEFLPKRRRSNKI